MQLKKVRLENIRSYLGQEIVFPEGSILLSGDIGSGKSTVLFAIDFALFGLRRGSLSGSSLLRNGKNRGFVELYFEVDGKDVVIKRNLKRDNSSVVQDSGYILIDGVKKEGTAIELKQMILDLLNYPKELLTKSKSLIYRYTVYTPQEEMKHILLGDKDSRLDILRKVFGIDKYKRINENSEKFVGKLKERKKELSGMIIDLDEKKREFENKLKNKNEIESKIKEILPLLENLKKKILNKKGEIKNVEENIKKLNSLKKELAINRVELKNKIEIIDKNKIEAERLKKQIKEIDDELKDKKIKEDYLPILKKKIEEKSKEIGMIGEELREFNSKISEFKTKIEGSEKIKKKISELDICPTCGQKVTIEHIRKVVEREEWDIKDFSEKIKLFNKREQEKEEELSDSCVELDKLKKEENEFGMIRFKFENSKEKERRKEEILSLIDELKKEVGDISVKQANLLEEIDKISNIEDDYNEIRRELEELQGKERKIDIEKAGFEKGLKDLEEFTLSLRREIEKKEAVKKELYYLGSLHEWFEKQFMKLMMIMERKVMFKVHNDFNDLFQKWFGMLVEDENLKIRLDEEFTPVIEQNEYEIDYSYLSGGEKTAAALAYRLALNQVINNLVSTIKTGDLLILDEPTDGFSTEQLDRVRVVLNELNLGQIILVSHEDKIESFVDNVVKFEKTGHVSRVI